MMFLAVLKNVEAKGMNSKTLKLEVADLWVGFLVSIIQLSPLHWPLYYSAKFWAQSLQGRATMDK